MQNKLIKEELNKQKEEENLNNDLPSSEEEKFRKR